MKDKDKIYYTRLFLSVVGGIISGLFKLALESAGEGILLFVLFYIISLYIIVYIYKIRPDTSPNITLRNIFIDGVGTYIVTWLFLWVFLYNLLIIT
jgi:hypothetical protein